MSIQHHFNLFYLYWFHKEGTWVYNFAYQIYLSIFLLYTWTDSFTAFTFELYNNFSESLYFEFMVQVLFHIIYGSGTFSRQIYRCCNNIISPNNNYHFILFSIDIRVSKWLDEILIEYKCNMPFQFCFRSYKKYFNLYTGFSLLIVKCGCSIYSLQLIQLNTNKLHSNKIHRDYVKKHYTDQLIALMLEHMQYVLYGKISQNNHCHRFGNIHLWQNVLSIVAYDFCCV